MRRTHRILWLTLAGLNLACSPTDTFGCQDDDMCSGAGASARCEASGFCSVEDEACDSGRRYTEFAQSGLANQCVGETDGGTLATTFDATETSEDTSTTSPVTSSTSSPSTSDASTTVDPTADASSGSSSSTGSDGPIPADWWDADWKRRYPVRLTALGGAQDISAFPVPVELPADAQGDGIRFVTAADNAPLHYERDGSVAWVLCDWSSDTDFDFFLYAGNPDASAMESTEVWGIYDAVWHLGDDTADAGPNQLGGTAEAVSLTPGVWDDGRRFDTMQEGIVIDAPGTDLPLNDGFSLSFWMDPTGTDVQQRSRIMEHSETEEHIGWQVVLLSDGPPDETQIAIELGRTTMERRFNTGNLTLQDGWHHYAIVVSPDEVDATLAIDDTPVPFFQGSEGSGTVGGGAATTASIGVTATFEGVPPLGAALDEIRVTEAQLSDTWFGGEHKMGDPAENVVVLGPLESID